MPKVTGRRRSEGFTPYWATRDGETARLYLGEVRDVLARLPERSVHCVVTSPPYWGLRDYGVDGQLGSEPCPDCGAWMVSGRIRRRPEDVRVLVACEYSGEVRRAFRSRGFDAWSCDTQPAEDGSEHHYQGDVTPILTRDWDLIIGHPPCTYLCRASTELNDRPGVDGLRREAADFFGRILSAPAAHVAVENPVPLRFLTDRFGRYSQIIHPRQFGHLETKETALWLRGLPTLVSEDDRTEESRSVPKSVRQKMRYTPPSPDRGRLRSRTFTGIARAMARQWGDHILGIPPAGGHRFSTCDRCFVCSMVAVFRGVRRVLRDDGTVWLNLGDTYSSQGGYTGRGPNSSISEAGKEGQLGSRGYNRAGVLPSGNLVGVPWRVALALQADGWVLRQDIIWAKSSPMPESVKNRCTKAHEYVFLLTKGMGYFYDAEAIKEPGWFGVKVQKHSGADLADAGDRYHNTKTGLRRVEMNGQSNKRDVWSVETPEVLAWLAENAPDTLAAYLAERTNRPDVWRVSSQGYPGAHFATFPPKLIEPMILAGTSERGCCAACGAPWRRVVVDLGPEGGHQHQRRGGDANPYALEKQTGLAEGGAGANWKRKTVDWEPGCECGAGVVPCTVCDPFVGSGTTVAVAVGLGRRGWGVDLSERYLRLNAVPRVEGALLRRPALAGQVVRDVAPTGGGRVVGSVRGGGVGGNGGV